MNILNRILHVDHLHGQVRDAYSFKPDFGCSLGQEYFHQCSRSRNYDTCSHPIFFSHWFAPPTHRLGVA